MYHLSINTAGVSRSNLLLLLSHLATSTQLISVASVAIIINRSKMLYTILTTNIWYSLVATSQCSRVIVK